ncbi:Uncharacterised protein [Burkholderia pseudomallei]|nr:Uncharacterised protein [Burkholderia pseudomallei]
METNLYGLDVIVSSPRDQRALDYLVQECGLERVRRARNELPGRTRPYVSNLARYLGATIPDDVVATPREEARRKLAELAGTLGIRLPRH